MKYGFESNMKCELSNNRWRLFCYRKPVSEFNEISVLQLLEFTKDVFEKILNSNALSHDYFKNMTKKPATNNA